MVIKGIWDGKKLHGEGILLNLQVPSCIHMPVLVWLNVRVTYGTIFLWDIILGYKCPYLPLFKSTHSTFQQSKEPFMFYFDPSVGSST